MDMGFAFSHTDSAVQNISKLLKVYGVELKDLLESTIKDTKTNDIVMECYIITGECSDETFEEIKHDNNLSEIFYEGRRTLM